MQLNIPTWLTLLRVALIPLFVLVFYSPFTSAPLVCALIFMLAAATDWFDGFLARRLQQITRFGAFLDPVADKIMVVTALVLVVEYYHVWWITLPAATMIVREIIISALREWMAELGKRNQVSVSWIGKAKTMLQMVSLVGLLWHPHQYVEMAAVAALYMATLLTFWSMLQYLAAARRDLLEF